MTTLTIEPVQVHPSSEYLRERPPRYLLQSHTHIPAKLSQVFDFFSRAQNLERITPPDMSFEILTPGPIAMHAGTVIDYRIRRGLVPMRWRTMIERFEPESLFVDAQHRGPYACWWHEHHFQAKGDATLMEDRVYYAPPLGPLGRLANALFVRRKLEHIFEYRARTIRATFAD